MILTIIVILAVIAADLATKYAATLNLAGKDAVTVIPRVVEFAYAENRGAAFSMLTEHRWVFLVFSSVAIAVILGYLFVKRPESRLMRVSLAMIAGGGIGNMIERIAHGYVTDFINPTFVDFAVFNVADSCVTIGCGLLILWMIVDTVRESKAKKLAGGSAEKAGDAPTGGSDEPTPESAESAGEPTAKNAGEAPAADGGEASEEAGEVSQDGEGGEGDRDE